MQFLIAEDDAVWQRFERSIVEAAGYECTAATTWPKVISLLKQRHAFEGMIIDLGLASDSEAGIEALQFIARLKPPNALVICTTSTNKMLQDCYALDFVKCVIPKNRIADHYDEIHDFFEGKISREKIQALVSSDLGVEQMATQRANSATKQSRKTVFVVHGRDAVARQEMFSLLRAMGLEPLEWSEAIRMTGKGSPFIGEVLDTAFHRAAAIVVLLTGDDEARLLKKYIVTDDPEHEKALTSQPRPNVLFEAGMAFGKNPDRTILVQFTDVRPFSDVAGRHVVRFHGSAKDRNELATRLETAGCAVNRVGKDWLSAGDFDKVCGIEPPQKPKAKKK